MSIIHWDSNQYLNDIKGIKAYTSTKEGPQLIGIENLFPSFHLKINTFGTSPVIKHEFEIYKYNSIKTVQMDFQMFPGQVLKV